MGLLYDKQQFIHLPCNFFEYSTSWHIQSVDTGFNIHLCICIITTKPGNLTVMKTPQEVIRPSCVFGQKKAHIFYKTILSCHFTL